MSIVLCCTVQRSYSVLVFLLMGPFKVLLRYCAFDCTTIVCRCVTRTFSSWNRPNVRKTNPTAFCLPSMGRRFTIY